MKKFLFLHFLITAFSLKSHSQNYTCKLKQTFYPNGNVHEEGCYVNKKKEGEWKAYNESDGKLRFIWTYKNNIKNGQYKVYTRTGLIEAIGKYENGNLVDTLKSFNDKGELKVYSVWQLSGDKKTTNMICKKVLISSANPDFTIDTVDGQRYIWLNGRRSLIK